MAEDESSTLDTKNLDKLIRALKSGRLKNIKIGIFGAKTFRSDGKTNAEIGTYHEFGTSTIPQRSFLRVPIQDNLDKYLEDSGAFNEGTLKEVVKQSDTTPWLQQVAVVAETIVMDAFDTGGFGKWKPSDMTNKQNAQTLVETQQLRNSISTEID